MAVNEEDAGYEPDPQPLAPIIDSEHNVTLPCGCTVMVTHVHGERRVVCKGGRGYAVNAEPQPVQYRVTALPVPALAGEEGEQ